MIINFMNNLEYTMINVGSVKKITASQKKTHGWFRVFEKSV